MRRASGKRAKQGGKEAADDPRPEHLQQQLNPGRQVGGSIEHEVPIHHREEQVPHRRLRARQESVCPLAAAGRRRRPRRRRPPLPPPPTPSVTSAESGEVRGRERAAPARWRRRQRGGGGAGKRIELRKSWWDGDGHVESNIIFIRFSLLFIYATYELEWLSDVSENGGV